MTAAAPSPADLPRKSALPRRTPLRGQIWHVAADAERPAIGTELWSDRPALIVSNDTSNARAGFAVIVYLTTSTNKRLSPTHVPLGQVIDHRETMALVEQIHTVDASRLVRHLGSVAESDMNQIDQALCFALGMTRRANSDSLFLKWEHQIKAHKIDLAEQQAALTGTVTDDRIAALQRANTLLLAQREAYRTIAETSTELDTITDPKD